MNSFSINLLVIMFVAALGTLGWFGLQQLERGNEYVVLEQGEQLPEPEPEPEVMVEPEPTPAPEPTVDPIVAELVNDLEQLIEDRVVMKEGSAGTRVGVVQRFLNEYFDRNDTIDNAYGPGTEARIRDFQRAEGLTADGQAGPNTYRKMIEALET